MRRNVASSMKVRKMKAKTIGLTCAAILCVLLGMSAPGYAGQDHQDEKHNQAKPKQNSHDQGRPSEEQKHQPQRHEESRPQPGDQHQQPDRARQEQRPQGDHVQQQTPDRAQQRQDQDRPQQHPQQARGYDHSQHTPELQRSNRRDWQQHRASHWQSDHRTWRQRGGYEGYLIPDQHFRGILRAGSWLQNRRFSRSWSWEDTRVFNIGGYWFSSMDPWPEYWGDDWYDTDTCTSTMWTTDIISSIAAIRGLALPSACPCNSTTGAVSKRAAPQIFKSAQELRDGKMLATVLIVILILTLPSECVALRSVGFRD